MQKKFKDRFEKKDMLFGVKKDVFSIFQKIRGLKITNINELKIFKNIIGKKNKSKIFYN